VTPSKEEFLKTWVPALPQGPRIIEEDASKWYDAVIAIDPDRFEWHYERSKGLGGSDIGEIVTWKFNEPNTFKTPWDIIKEKLLIHTIQPQNNDMRRGTYLEPIVQKIFLEDFDATRREDYCDAIDNMTAHNHPWMRGNVDDVVDINGYTYIVDYKCPSKVKHGQTMLCYAGQVHQYNYLLGQHLGKPEGEPGADGLLIASFDYPNGVVDPVEVEFDPAIMSAVLDGGDEIWNHVLNGTFPEKSFSKKEDVTYSKAEKSTIGELEETFIRKKLLADMASDEFKKTHAILGKALTQNNNTALKGQKVPMEILSLTVREKADDKKLLKMISESRLDVSAFQKKGSKMDPVKMEETLESLDYDLETCLKDEWDINKIKEYCLKNNIAPPMIETISPTLRANKKTIDPEALQIAKDSAKDIVLAGVPKVDLGDDEEMEINEEINSGLSV
jgi:hypothetical protein